MPVGSSLILLTIVAMAIFAPLIAPHDPLSKVDGAIQFQGPAWQDGGSWDVPLGTDNLSRDVLSRTIYGARVSVIVGLTGTAVAGAIGMIMGVAAGYFGGWVDSMIMRIVDAWLAIPTLVLAILMATVLGASMWNIVLILGVVYWTRYARILRSEVLSLRERDFVKLAQVAGASKTRIILRHIVPNVLNTWLVLASLTVGVVIIAEASLSFLGVGVPPPTPAWGSMLTESRSALITNRPHLIYGPALCIGLTVLATNLFGDWLRVKLDPRQRNL
ncbi:MAG: ABC transporter permease [Actinomycetia bacterium]|nr:ABC transporter permease [Actinomycetes bacterium]